jgi:light-regulated signal transduction histidine kinase (bacteriophytochrome)
VENLSRELDALSHSVSHDLRAPIRAVDGFSSILLEDHAEALDDEGRRILGVIRQSAQQLAQMIDGLLKLSRLGRSKLEPALLDMTALAQIAAREATQDPRYRHAAVTVDPLPDVEADRALVRQLWNHLIGNAVKFSSRRERPAVRVSGQRDGDEAHYQVRDNGTGFDPAVADRLFTAFQRLPGGDAYEGTGIGLPIVLRIVHRHGGRVWAESEAGRGATFHFTLPPRIPDA